MIHARSAHGMATATRDRLERARHDLKLAEIEAEVIAAASRGDYSCSLEWEPHNVTAIHQALEEVGFTVGATGRGKTLRLCVSWGAPKERP